MNESMNVATEIGTLRAVSATPQRTSNPSLLGFAVFGAPENAQSAGFSPYHTRLSGPDERVSERRDNRRENGKEPGGKEPRNLEILQRRFSSQLQSPRRHLKYQFLHTFQPWTAGEPE
jgi:hypothetical protein